MIEKIKQTYLALFHEYPPLIGLAIVAGTGQLPFALLNNYAIPLYLAHELHISKPMIGAVSATFLISEMLLKFPMGRLSDRFGRKPFIALGPLLVCLNPALIVSLPARFWMLIFPLRTADGAGAAAIWPPLFAMVGDLVKNRSRAAAMSVMNAIYLAAVGGGVVVGLVIASVTDNTRLPFYLATALLFISGMTAYLWLPNPRVRTANDDNNQESLKAIIEQNDPHEKATKYPMPVVLAITFLMSFGVLILPAFLVLYLEEHMGFTSQQILQLIIALAIPVVVLGLPLGHAADRWGKKLAVQVALSIAALVMWAIPSCHTMLCFGVVAVLMVVSHAMATPAWLAIVSELAPSSHRGRVMGMVATAEGIGASLGPLAGGFLWGPKDASRPEFIFYGSAAVLTLAAALAVFALRAHPDQSDAHSSFAEEKVDCQV